MRQRYRDRANWQAGSPGSSLAAVSVLGALQIGRADPGPNTRIGRLFMVGSFCFAVASLPFMADFDNRVAGLIYFVGSIFFTAAGAETLRYAEPSDRLDLVASAVQLAGTIMFNLNTYAALFEGLDRHSQRGLVWLPDAVGSVCFLVASGLAVVAVRRARTAGGGDRRGSEIAWLNLLGSIFFMVSALASVVLKTGEELNLEAATWLTLAGAVCFFAAAYLLVPRRVSS
jgi:hypothetical protein